MELPRTNKESTFAVTVRKSATKKQVAVVFTNSTTGNNVGVALDAREIDDLCVMLQYAKKVGIEEGGELD